jgi:phosphoserine phosphatase RsbU/P
MPANPENLRLTDFMDLATLQEIQDGFAAVANVTAIFTDEKGQVLTQKAPTKDFLRRQRAIAAVEDGEGPQREGREYVAPIVVSNRRLGTIRMLSNGTIGGLDDGKLSQLAQKFGLDLKQLKSLAQSMARARNTRPAAIQFLFLLANAVARLCYQEFELRQRISELTVVSTVAVALAQARDLNKVLQRIVRLACDLMEAKSASIRLIDTEHDELSINAVHNLSRQYLQKGRILLSKAEIDKVALSPQGYEYVRNMSQDSRVQYPEESKREGITSMLSVGMRFKDKPIGVLRVYTEHEQSFSDLKIDLLKAVAAQAAAAIENARLADEAVEAEALERQVRMAADVQQRMLPTEPPKLPNVELACEYVPCFALGGDFFDFIELPDQNLGLVIADVSGKGVPASLIMASVRAALRAQVDNLYYLYEVMGRLNHMLFRDTKQSEFVTLFYGVLDTRTRRLTYCNAGHPPPLLLRDGKVTELLSNNLVLGVSAEEKYEQHLLDLQPGDAFMLYTDGLFDAMNFEHQIFGRQRVIEAFGASSGSADAIAENVLWSMRRFSGLTERTDDVTLVVAKMT